MSKDEKASQKDFLIFSSCFGCGDEVDVDFAKAAELLFSIYAQKSEIHIKLTG